MPLFVRNPKSTITQGVVVRPFSNGSVLVKADNDLGMIICYDDNEDTDEVPILQANDKVKIEISGLDPNRGWILEKC